ncbi:hypothetical protein HDU67_003392, partial [Dinochytrium kinnereticum]
MADPSTLVHPFARFFITGRFADAVLRPGISRQLGKSGAAASSATLETHTIEIAVHKVILAAQSPYFDELFFTETTEEAPAVPSDSHQSDSEEDEEEKFDDAHQGFSDGDADPSTSNTYTAVTDGDRSPLTLAGSIDLPNNKSDTRRNEAITSGKHLAAFTVHEVDECSLRLALDWFYFGDLDLSLQSAWGVWTASKTFRVPALSARVEGFIEGMLDASETAFSEAMENEIDIMDAAMGISE